MSKKLTKIIIKNFQSHRDTTLEFDPNGITTFKGATDKGKSSILRAINLVVNNQPTGEAFISDWVPRTPKGNALKGNTSVELHTGEGYVRREKGKDNLYFIKTNAMEKERELKNFGSGKVPDEVKEFFNFSPINIQEQKDTHFLIDDNPPTVAKYISKIVDLEIVDRAEANINSALRSAKKIKDAKAATIVTVTDQLAPFSKIESCDSMLSRIEKKQSSVDKSQVLIVGIGSNVDNKRITMIAIERAQKILFSSEKLYSIKTKSDAFRVAQEGIAVLESTRAQYKTTSDKLLTFGSVMGGEKTVGVITNNFNSFQSVLAEASIIETSLTRLKLNRVGLEKSKKILAFNANRIQNKHKMYGKALADLTALKKAFETYKATVGTIDQTTIALAKNREEYIAIRGAVCPTCKKPWEEKHGH